jgi:CSLREA domain-containing protein
MFALSLQAAHAATITVTTTADEQSVNGQCSLREAVQAANTDATVDACSAGNGADTIMVPAGIYTLTITGTIPIQYADNLLEITSDISLIGAGRELTIIKGTGICHWLMEPCPPNNRVLFIAPNATVELSFVTISQNASTIGSTAFNGGGILNLGKLKINAARVQNSSASQFGGGIYNAGILELRDAEVISNSTGSPYSGSFVAGGGIYNTGILNVVTSRIINNSPQGITNDGKATIDSSTIENNNSTGVVNHAQMQLLHSQIVSNSSGGAGGIYNTGNLEIDSSIILSNTATASGDRSGSHPGQCGGILSGGSLTMTNSIVQFNKALNAFDRYSGRYLPSSGGGMCIVGNALIQRSAIISNTADYGGGLFVQQFNLNPTTHASLQNVTIGSNTAYSQSGGLHLIGGTIEMNFTTVASNTSPIASNVFVTSTIRTDWAFLPVTRVIPGTLYLHNTLLAGGNNGNCTNEGGAIESAGFNLSSDATCTTLTTIGDITNTNPLLGPLQMNWPGTTLTHALLPGSPAINKGEYVRSDSALTDQRGAFRRWGGEYADIGAYEVFDPSILRSVYLPITSRK